MSRHLVRGLFCLLFFHGLISEVVFRTSWALNGEADSRMNQFVFELAVCVTVGWLLRGRSVRLPPGTAWFSLYVAWCLVSGLFTTDSVFDAFMYCRYGTYAFTFLIAVWNYPFDTPDLGRFNRLLLALAAVQLMATALKLFGWNERTEWRVGTMTTAGGGLATLFPLLTVSYALGYYFYVRRSLWVLLAGFSFLLVGFASGKRAIYFVVPALALAIIILYCWLERGRMLAAVLPRLILHLGLCAMAVLPAVVYGISHSDGIGVSSDGATVSEIFEHALDYAQVYEYGRANNGMVAGRSGASEKVFEAIMDEPVSTLLFGWGPAALMPKRGDALQGGGGFRPLGITYGIVGWSHDAISIGLPGTALHLLFLLTLARGLYRRTRQADLSTLWRGLCFGTLAGFVGLLYSYLFYSVPHVLVEFVLYFYVAIVLSPLYRLRLTSMYDAYSRLRFRIVPVTVPARGRVPF